MIYTELGSPAVMTLLRAGNEHFEASGSRRSDELLTCSYQCDSRVGRSMIYSRIKSTGEH